MRLTQCKVKNKVKHVAGSSFFPIVCHYFSDGRIIPLFLLLLSSLPTIHLTINDHAIWNVNGLSIFLFQKLALPRCTKFSRKTRKLLKLKLKQMDTIRIEVITKHLLKTCILCYFPVQSNRMKS